MLLEEKISSVFITYLAMILFQRRLVDTSEVQSDELPRLIYKMFKSQCNIYYLTLLSKMQPKSVTKFAVNAPQDKQS